MAKPAQFVPDFGPTGNAQFVPDFGGNIPPPASVKKIYIGGAQVQSISLGNVDIVKVYLGSVLLFGEP